MRDYILRLLGLEKIYTQFQLQILYQDAVLREIAVRLDTLIEQVKHIENEIDAPEFDPLVETKYGQKRLREILQIHYSNLHELKKQAAYYGIKQPIDIINEIKIIEMEIDELEQRIKSQ